MTVQKILSELGLNEKQARTYTALLEQGRTTPAQLASITGINRSTTYAVAKELREKGLITEDLGGKKNFLVALPPENLNNIIRKEESDLNKKKTLIDQAVTELKNITKHTKYSIPKITFVGESDIANFLHKQADVWCQSTTKYDTIWWGFQDPTFLKFYQGWIDSFWKTVAPKNLSTRLLTNQSKFEQIMNSRGYTNRLVKFWNGEGKFSASTWVTGDYLIMVVTDQKPHYLVQIYDAKLAENMRELFKGIWEGIR